MKKTLNTTLAAVSVAILVTLTLSSCESGRRRHGDSGWHNMGVGPKDNRSMPDANMPGKR